MPGLSCVLGGTEEEARANHIVILDLGDVPLAIEYLSESLCCDLTSFDPDGEIPFDAILAKTLLPKADAAKAVQPAAEKGTPLGDFAANFMRHPRGHNAFVASYDLTGRPTGSPDPIRVGPTRRHVRPS